MDQQLTKIHTMLYSKDEELRNLGFTALRGHVVTWQEFKRLRGVSIMGNPFYPYVMQAQIRNFGRELKSKWIKEMYRTGKLSKRAMEGIHKYGYRKNSRHAKVKRQRDESSGRSLLQDQTQGS